MKQLPKRAYVLVGLLLTTGIVASWYALTRPDVPATTAQNTAQIAAKPGSVEPAAAKTHEQRQNDMLLYLIEEEKLAHDVYTVMHDFYGARVFGNILSSEQNHQSQVLTLLQARKLVDPRSDEVGVFKNAELQALYNQLVAQGKQSAEEAYKAGVTVEERDIADITRQLATATDDDIVATLERLRTASENHLRAYNRQLSRY